MDEGPGGRKLSIKGTGEVRLETTWGEVLAGVVPIPQIHRINAVLIECDFAGMQSPPALPPGTPGQCTISLTNAERRRVSHASSTAGQDPRFEHVRGELHALIEELFPAAKKKPGLLKRLFGKGAQS